MLLLIFFLLTSQFVIQTGVKVKLPGAKNNEQLAPAKLVISISKNERIFFGNKEISLDELAGKISQVVSDSKESNLVIHSDKDAKLDIIIKVIDAAKGIGINKFTIETEKESF